jgi:1-acyl-sn-glycerol-3-phosphate acyltransferase
MFRNLKFYGKLVLSLIVVIPQIGRIKRMRETYGDAVTDDFIYHYVKKWAVARIKDTGCRVNVHNRENLPNGNVVFISNHLSNLDFLVLMAEIDKPFGFIAKVELEKIPLLRDWMRLINCLFIDRSNMKQQVKTIIAGIALIKKGKSLLIFPEGTRSTDGKMLDFKAGSFKLATKTNVPIVPLTIMGTSYALEDNNFKIRPCDIDLYIHEPIYTDKLTKEEKDTLHTYVRSIIAKPFNNK